MEHTTTIVPVIITADELSEFWRQQARELADRGISSSLIASTMTYTGLGIAIWNTDKAAALAIMSITESAIQAAREILAERADAPPPPTAEIVQLHDKPQGHGD